MHCMNSLIITNMYIVMHLLERFFFKFCFNFCRVPGNAWALEQAKHNLVHNYFLVGVTEELKDFVAMLEYSIPQMFKGALDLYISGKIRESVN